MIARHCSKFVRKRENDYYIALPIYGNVLYFSIRVSALYGRHCALSWSACVGAGVTLGMLVDAGITSDDVGTPPIRPSVIRIQCSLSPHRLTSIPSRSSVRLPSNPITFCTAHPLPMVLAHAVVIPRH